MEINPNLSENTRFDDEFILAASSGVEEAFNQLMNRYKFAVYFMLLKMVTNRKDAEYLTIETFGKAYSNISQYDHHAAFSAWLYRIAYDRAVVHLQKRDS